MLSIKYIRENVDKVQKAIDSKNVEFNLDDALKLDDRRRSIIGEVDSPGLYSLTSSEPNQVQGRTTQSNRGLPTLIDSIQKAGGVVWQQP